MGCYGPPWIRGSTLGKTIVEFELDKRTHLLRSVPQTILQYVGDRYTTVLGLAEGPDGLYFTDFFGETDSSDAAGTGAVWKVVGSEETLGLPEFEEESFAALPPAERGKFHFHRNCRTCHKIDGVGGAEGPDLSLFRREMEIRLHSKAYVESVKRLLISEQSFVREQTPRLREVMAAEGDERVRVWLRHHLEEPRFDNTRSHMPNFLLVKKRDRQDIVEFLMRR